MTSVISRLHTQQEEWQRLQLGGKHRQQANMHLCVQKADSCIYLPPKLLMMERIEWATFEA